MNIKSMFLAVLTLYALGALVGGCKKIENTKAVTERWARAFGEWNAQFTELKTASEATTKRMSELAKPLQENSRAGIAYKTANDLTASLGGALDAARGMLEKFAGMFNDAKTQGKVAGITAVQAEAEKVLPPVLTSTTELIAKTIAAVDAADAEIAAEAKSPVAKLARGGGMATTSLFAPGTSTLMTAVVSKTQLSAADVVALAHACPEIKLALTHKAPTADIAEARVAAFGQYLTEQNVGPENVQSHQASAPVGKKVANAPDTLEISVVSKCPGM